MDKQQLKEYRNNYYHDNREHILSLLRKRRQSARKPCPDCDKLMWVTSKHCIRCAPKGNRNPNWKGGRTVRFGYVFIKIPNHPKANSCGYVQEHIVIWEQTNGKPLPEGWVIHHLNGIRGDNRSVNLLALPNKKHSLVLKAKAKRIQELEAKLNNQGQLL